MKKGFVKNGYGVEINFDVAVENMDDAVREAVAFVFAPCSDQFFFNQYAKLHFAKFGEIWELAKPNPVY